MAVATPVLERKIVSDKTCETVTYQGRSMSAEEIHNSRISENYSRLINPDYTIADMFVEREKEAAPQAPAPVQIPAAPVKPYLVENARATADIFRADSLVNKKAEAAIAPAQNIEEEDNEDLRPTPTTIQYKTVGESDKKTTVKIANVEKERVLSKKEKIVIAAFIGIVVALFALIIINSAVIANLNNEIYALENGISTARSSLESVNSEIGAVLSPESIAEFARTHGLVLMR